jgi:DNA polymerase-3 subunit epsilon
VSAAAAVGPPMAVETMAAVLSHHADFRVLRRMRPMRRDGLLAGHPSLLIGCALDVETTGLDHREDVIIELALQRFWAEPGGRIVITGKPHSWVEDPGRPIAPEISRLTGLTDHDVAGRSIIDPVAASLIADADFVVAHNAAFDRPFVEKRLPFAAGRPWVCTMKDVEWKEEGYEGRVLGHLLMQMGWFFDAHRASTDVTALLHLLDQPLRSGGTVLTAAVKTAAKPGWLFEAADAPFDAKDALKARGYRWDAEARHWAKEIPGGVFEEECEWIALNVYRGRGRPRFRPITWRERHAARR